MATYDVTVILGPGSLKRFGLISPIVDLRSILGSPGEEADRGLSEQPR